MPRKPNFIVIHTDQQRYDCVGAARRRTGIYTPYIDSIAYQGAYFTSCYASCPLCIPQRLSLLTGQMPHHHGFFSNTGIPYLPLETTLPLEMRRGGYETALVGRTMHTYPFNFSYGFEYYLPGDPSSEFKDSSDPFFTFLRENTSREAGGYYGGGPHNNSRAAGPFHLPDEFHQTKWATNRAIDFLDGRDRSRPFLLFVGYYAPHSPHNPPAEYFNRYYFREDLDGPAIAPYDIPPASNGNVMSRYINLEGEELRAARAGYYGNIAFLDSQVGRILERAMRYPNTYVIFTSDHGELLGDHYMYQKGRPYEGASHIPFMIMGPGIPDSQIIESPVIWEDIMPTILDLADLPIPSSVDGRSMKTLLSHGKDPEWRSYMHGETVHTFMGCAGTKPASGQINLFYEKGSHYLTDGKTKYIWHITSGTEQLFDLTRDWKELCDLSADPDHAEELKLWRSRMVRQLAGREEGFCDGNSLIPGREPEFVSSSIEQLKQKRLAEGFKIAYSRPSPRECDLSDIIRLLS